MEIEIKFETSSINEIFLLYKKERRRFIFKIIDSSEKSTYTFVYYYNSIKLTGDIAFEISKKIIKDTFDDLTQKFKVFIMISGN